MPLNVAESRTRTRAAHAFTRWSEMGASLPRSQILGLGLRARPIRCLLLPGRLPAHLGVNLLDLRLKERSDVGGDLVVLAQRLLNQGRGRFDFFRLHARVSELLHFFAQFRDEGD